MRRAATQASTLTIRTLASVALVIGLSSEALAAELLVGAATTSITPDRPVALSGQMHTRIAREVESPVTATALALESRQGDEVLDQAILVSCDLVATRRGMIEEVRKGLADRLPDFDPRKLAMKNSRLALYHPMRWSCTSSDWET